MRFTPGMKKVGGRKAGTPNRLTSSLRAAMLLAFEDIGGRKALAKWAGKNRADFYRLVVRLIPVEKANPESEGVTVIISRPIPTIEFPAKEHLQYSAPPAPVLDLPEPHDASGDAE